MLMSVAGGSGTASVRGTTNTVRPALLPPTCSDGSHKVFNFCFWASVYTTFVAVILIIDLALPTRSGAEPPTDIYEIVMLILAVLFMMFTIGADASSQHPGDLAC